jgi:hypothetical protein
MSIEFVGSACHLARALRSGIEVEALLVSPFQVTKVAGAFAVMEITPMALLAAPSRFKHWLME